MCNDYRDYRLQGEVSRSLREEADRQKQKEDAEGPTKNIPSRDLQAVEA